MSALSDTLEPLLEQKEETSNVLIHMLRDRTALISLETPESEKNLLILDNVTSRAIRHGGSLRADSLDLKQISPFLQKRMIGKFNLPL